jgi:uncharacterized membrane-anchored protein
MASAKTEYIRLAIALGVLLLILGSFLLYLSLPYLSQKEVILATMPVDPFDPLRGQYIIIGYEIGSVPKIQDASVGDTVYISLSEDSEGVSRYSSASLTQPNSGDFIRGTITFIPDYSANMSIEYGIEQYFFERGATFNTRGMNVKVKLADSGRAAIVKLLDENLKPVEIVYENKSWTA